MPQFAKIYTQREVHLLELTPLITTIVEEVRIDDTVIVAEFFYLVLYFNFSVVSFEDKPRRV